MQEHEDKDVEPDPAGAEAGAPRNRQQGGLVAETAWGLVAGVVVVVLLVVVVEICFRDITRLTDVINQKE